MAQTILKELTYDDSKVVVEVARRDAQGRTIDTTYATKAELPAEYVAIEGFKADYLDANDVAYKNEIPFEKISINLVTVEDTSLDISDYKQLWLDILVGNFVLDTTLQIGISANGSKRAILNIPINKNSASHAIVCITDTVSLSFVAYYTNSSTNTVQFDAGITPHATHIYFEASGIRSSSTLAIDGFAILDEEI